VPSNKVQPSICWFPCAVLFPVCPLGSETALANTALLHLSGIHVVDFSSALLVDV